MKQAMKYFLVCFAGLAACEKDEPTELQKFTLDQFEGNWVLDYLDFEGVRYGLVPGNGIVDACVDIDSKAAFVFSFSYARSNGYAMLLFPCYGIARGFNPKLGPGVNQIEFSNSDNLVTYSFKIKELNESDMILELLGATDAPSRRPYGGLYHFRSAP